MLEEEREAVDANVVSRKYSNGPRRLTATGAAGAAGGGGGGGGGGYMKYTLELLPLD